MNWICIANAYYQTRNDRFERVNVFQNYDTVTAPKESVTRSTVKEKTLAVGKEEKKREIFLRVFSTRNSCIYVVNCITFITIVISHLRVQRLFFFKTHF